MGLSKQFKNSDRIYLYYNTNLMIIDKTKTICTDIRLEYKNVEKWGWKSFKEFEQFVFMHDLDTSSDTVWCNNLIRLK